MKILTAHTIERSITTLVIGLVLSMIGILFYFLSLRLGEVAKENQAYDRYISCVLSVPGRERNTEKIENCYNEAQKDTGVTIKRYDTKN
jgi:hypothetical protein